jgi:hypothetical protein
MQRAAGKSRPVLTLDELFQVPPGLNKAALKFVVTDALVLLCELFQPIGERAAPGVFDPLVDGVERFINDLGHAERRRPGLATKELVGHLDCHLARTRVDQVTAADATIERRDQTRREPFPTLFEACVRLRGVVLGGG